MADPTKGRRPAYLDRYARTLAAVYRVEAIEAAVQRGRTASSTWTASSRRSVRP